MCSIYQWHRSHTDDIKAFARLCLHPFSVYIGLVMEDLGMIELSSINFSIQSYTETGALALNGRLSVMVNLIV